MALPALAGWEEGVGGHIRNATAYNALSRCSLTLGALLCLAAAPLSTPPFQHPPASSASTHAASLRLLPAIARSNAFMEGI